MVPWYLMFRGTLYILCVQLYCTRARVAIATARDGAPGSSTLSRVWPPSPSRRVYEKGELHELHEFIAGRATNSNNVFKMDTASRTALNTFVAATAAHNR